MKVLVRLDDYTPNRNFAAWSEVERILDAHAIRPLVAVVPRDRYFGASPTTESFWHDVRALQSKGWSIALHGDTHLVVPIAPGTRREIFFARKSEFIGLSREAQLAKLESAWQEFVEHGVHPSVFVAPGHGFDSETVHALVQHGRMQLISDGIALRPFVDRGLHWLPQIDWRMPRLRCGFRTVCLHPSTMSSAEIRRFAIEVRRSGGCFVELAALQPGAFARRTAGDRAFELMFCAYYRAKQTLYRTLQPVLRPS